MNILKKVAVIFVGLLALAVIVSCFLPSKVHLERATEIKAPVEAVYPQVASLRLAEKWSPWKELEPEVVNTYEGPEAAVGEKMSWKGNKLKEGSQTTVKMEPNKSIQQEMVFNGEGKALINWTFEREANGGTKVVWAYDQDLGFNPMARIAMSVMNMDKMMGPQFEKGLANLKNRVESAAMAAPMDSSKTQTTAEQAPAK